MVHHNIHYMDIFHFLFVYHNYQIINPPLYNINILVDFLLLLSEYIPQIDIDHFNELAAQARDKANTKKMEETGKGENILDEGLKETTGEEY